MCRAASAYDNRCALQMLSIKVLVGQQDSTAGANADAAPLQAALACGPIRISSKEESSSQAGSTVV